MAATLLCFSGGLLLLEPPVMIRHGHDRDDYHGDGSPELGEAAAFGGVAHGGLLGGFAFGTRLLAALLACQVLVVPHLAHGWNFYRFLFKNA